MKKYYVSSLTSKTAISRYSNDFYQLVLRDKGYISVDSHSKSVVEMLSLISSRDQVHIEISGQKKELDLLTLMLNARYKNVSVTLHNPMRIKFTFYELNNSLFNRISRIYDRYATASKYLGQLQSIYVLSRKGMDQIKRKYKIDNVSYLPYIVNHQEIDRNIDIYSDVIEFDPSGGKKEIGLWLQLHKQLMAHDSQLGNQATVSEGNGHSNGLRITGSLQDDNETIRKIIADASLAEQIKKETYSYLIKHHSADAVKLQYKD